MPSNRPRSRRSTTLALTLSASAVLAAVGVRGQATKQAPSASADPAINRQFHKGDVKEIAAKLESETREVFARREAIVEALNLKPGMAVADLGAGTGLFVRLLADRVGPEGTVYAVEVSRPLLRHLAERAEAQRLAQVKTVLATQESTHLSAGSVDLVFLCDVYHHFERPRETLASIRRALRPDGALVLIELDRTRPKADDFVKGHVRADPSTFADEIKAAGFEPVPVPNAPALKENVFLRFRKVSSPVAPAAN